MHGHVASISQLKKAISNSNWTEWRVNQGVIAQAISKSDECEARSDLKLGARLLLELYDTRPYTNYFIYLLYGQYL